MGERPVIRTQVQLTEERVRALKALSARTGLSVAELIRRSLAPLLESMVTEDDERYRRAIAAAGRFRSGQADLAVEHDRYLAED
jgi:predicted DNA-binding protein